MSLARLSASILCVSDRSGAGPRSAVISDLGGLWEAVGTDGIYTHHGASVGPDQTDLDEIHLDLKCRSRDDSRSVALRLTRWGGHDLPIGLHNLHERYDLGPYSNPSGGGPGALRAHGHGRGPHSEEIGGGAPGGGAPHSHDRHARRPGGPPR